MRQHTRTAIAYIAARLASDRQVDSVRDSSLDEDFWLEGEVSSSQIFLYDPERGATLSGFGKQGSFNLYDSGDMAEISLSISGCEFSGFDHGTSTHFHGVVRRESVSFYDSGEPASFEFSVDCLV